MKTTTKLLKYGLLIITMIVSSCSPEDGMDGATGPQGPQGLAGQDGVDGEDGNANVQTGTVNLTNGDWLWNSSYTFATSSGGLNTSWFSRYVDIVVAEINDDIDQNGVVLVYFKASSGGGWQPLPFQFTSFGAGTYITNIAFESSVGNIRLHYFWTPNTGSVPAGLSTHPIADHSFKYVIIQGTAVAKGSGNYGVDFKKMSYEEVMDYFGLVD